MSVNYYAFGPFPGGPPDGEGLHIGQSVAGQRFLFRAVVGAFRPVRPAECHSTR